MNLRNLFKSISQKAVDTEQGAQNAVRGVAKVGYNTVKGVAKTGVNAVVGVEKQAENLVHKVIGGKKPKKTVKKAKKTTAKKAKK